MRLMRSDEDRVHGSALINCHERIGTDSTIATRRPIKISAFNTIRYIVCDYQWGKSGGELVGSNWLLAATGVAYAVVADNGEWIPGELGQF